MLLPLQLYIENILALDEKARAAGHGTGRPLPLAIMTSDDTHAATQALLAENNHFGAAPEQIHLLKQEKVGSALISHLQAKLFAHQRCWQRATSLAPCRCTFTCSSKRWCSAETESSSIAGLCQKPLLGCTHAAALQWQQLLAGHNSSPIFKSHNVPCRSIPGAMPVGWRCTPGAGPKGPLPPADQATRTRRRALASGATPI